MKPYAKNPEAREWIEAELLKVDESRCSIGGMAVEGCWKSAESFS
ncbi:MAG: hypothetical protein QM627_08980 [Luteolibacter sp.]